MMNSFMDSFLSLLLISEILRCYTAVKEGELTTESTIQIILLLGAIQLSSHSHVFSSGLNTSADIFLSVSTGETHEVAAGRLTG